MGIPVSVKQVAEELDALFDESTAYINRETGEIYTVTNEDAQYADAEEEQEEEEEEEEGEEDLPDWQKESVAKAREVLNSEAWIALPGKFEINEWEIMRDFAQSQSDEELSENLLRAIHGSGAFRYFKDTIAQYGIREEWFEFKRGELEKIAREALEEAGIPFIEESD